MLFIQHSPNAFAIFEKHCIFAPRIYITFVINNMATREYIESLHIEDNVFALKEDTILNYLVHYAAPFTGDGQIVVPAGMKFAAHGPMRCDTLYMHPIEEDEALCKRMEEKEKANIPQLANRLAGFSFYITKEEVKNLKLDFVAGSKERLLEIFQLIKETESVQCTSSSHIDSENKISESLPSNAVDDLPF